MQAASGTLMDVLRAVISYAHSSYRVSISFQVKRFDKVHGQVWVKVNPDEVPAGYNLKYILQHITFYTGPLPLLVFVWCPQLLQNRRYSSKMINHWRNPAHQVKALGTSRSLDWFADFMYALLEGLSYTMIFVHCSVAYSDSDNC